MYGLDGIRFGSVSMVTTSLGANDPKVGDIAREGEDLYRFVYNAGGEQIQPSYACTLSAVTGYSVTISSTTSVDVCVGVVKHATITTGAYGWVLIHGFAPVEMGANLSAAAGGLLALAADGTFTNKTISTGWVGPTVGKAMEAIASGASGSAYICCWGA